MFSLPRSQGGASRLSFRSAVRAAQVEFLRTFTGPLNAANQPFIVCVDNAQKMMTIHDAVSAALATRLQINRLETAIACLLCRGLRISLEALSGIHPGFKVRQPLMEFLGAPDLTYGLAAIHAFALEATEPERYRLFQFDAAGSLANLGRLAVAHYWQASWYPHVPWILPGPDEGQMQVESIRGTNQPEDACFFMLPPGQSTPHFDERPAGDEHTDIWWYLRLRRFPPETLVWQGERLWVPLCEYVSELARKANQGS
jgi:hypothetical protein